MNLNQAVILAGGLGTRLRPFTDNNPKPMYPIQGTPFLEYLLYQIKEWGIENVILLLGYMPDKIMDYFGDGKNMGLNIKYNITPVEYDTGSRLRAASHLLKKNFLLMYCDNYCPFNFKKAWLQYQNSGKKVQITAYENADGYTKGNLQLNKEEIVVYDKQRKSSNLQEVDIGYAFVDRSVLFMLPDGNVNFEKEIYHRLVDINALGVFVTKHRYYSIGSWERIQLTEAFFAPKKVVFLDRDGTINKRPPKACYVNTPEEFVWLPNAREAIRELKDHGYQIYLISNQPGIARGMLTQENLGKIHEKLQRELQEYGTKLDGIYVCPHGWNDGCDCRKPKPGLLYQAQKEHSLNLTTCILIGDDERDIQAGEAADLAENILVSETYSLFDAVQNILGVCEK